MCLIVPGSENDWPLKQHWRKHCQELHVNMLGKFPCPHEKVSTLFLSLCRFVQINKHMLYSIWSVDHIPAKQESIPVGCISPASKTYVLKFQWPPSDVALGVVLIEQVWKGLQWLPPDVTSRGSLSLMSIGELGGWRGVPYLNFSVGGGGVTYLTFPRLG